MLIQGIVSIQTTPLVEAPVNIGEISVSTDFEGKFQAVVPVSQDASISSGLKAIKFETIADEQRETLPGTGADIAAIAATKGGWIVIEASRRVNPEPICLTYNETGAEVLWFRYTNRYGETLQVPQMGLNSLSSPSGQPYPVSEFRSTDETQPDGFFGFEWGIDFFTWFNSTTNQEMVSASWKLLGKEVMVEQPKAEVPLCPSSGELAGCTEFSEAMSNRLFEQALSTVTRLSQECEVAKQMREWSPQGNLRHPYFRTAARALRNIRQILRSLPRNRYICDGAAPAGCQTRTYPKTAILAEFDSILRVKLPSGLQRRLPRLYPRQRRAFIAELNRQPTTFYSCNR
jgi:hypothetical protein